MPDYVMLVGVEEIQRAAHTIGSAASDMIRAAGYMDDALSEHIRSLEEIVRRFEAAVDKLAEIDSARRALTSGAPGNE